MPATLVRVRTSRITLLCRLRDNIAVETGSWNELQLVDPIYVVLVPMRLDWVGSLSMLSVVHRTYTAGTYSTAVLKEEFRVFTAL